MAARWNRHSRFRLRRRGEIVCSVGIKGGKVMALDRDNGELLWTFKAGEDATGLHALANQLIVGTKGNYVYSLNPTNGHITSGGLAGWRRCHRRTNGG